MNEVEVFVCIKCKKMGEPQNDEKRDGQSLFEELNARFAVDETIKISPVECLSACDYGCNIALTGDSRWSYVYSQLNKDEHAQEIENGIRAYKNTADGLVPWRERPMIFRKQSIARIPPKEGIK